MFWSLFLIDIHKHKYKHTWCPYEKFAFLSNAFFNATTMEISRIISIERITIIVDSSNFKACKKLRFILNLKQWSILYILYICCIKKKKRATTLMLLLSPSSDVRVFCFIKKIPSSSFSLVFYSQYTWDQFTAGMVLLEPFATKNFAFYYRFSDALAKFNATQPNHRSTHFVDMYCLFAFGPSERESASTVLSFNKNKIKQ